MQPDEMFFAADLEKFASFFSVFAALTSLLRPPLFGHSFLSLFKK